MPVCELKNNNSRLYPSDLIFDQLMNCGVGDPRKFGVDLDIVSDKSIGFTSTEHIGD